MALTQLLIDIPSLSDSSKKMEVEGAIAVGEKVAVTVTGLPTGVSESAKELRLRVLGPMGEDIATHSDWTEGEKAYTTTLDLASVQAYRLFFPPIPFPPRAPMPPRPIMPPPVGYDPVAAAAVKNPPQNVTVRLVLELRDKDGSDSDADLLDASLIGMANVRLNYWPTDWQTATLVDLANGRVYSKDEVDAMIAEEARQRGVADAAEAAARASGDAETLASSKAYTDEKALLLDKKINTKYAKPSGGIPKSDLSASVQASLGKADTALQEHQDISGKADLVGGKVPSSQLPYSHESISSKNGVLSVSANNDVTATIDVSKDVFVAYISIGPSKYTFYFEDSIQSVAAGISAGIHFSILRNSFFAPQYNGLYDNCSAAFIGIVDGKAKYGPVRGYIAISSDTVMLFDENGAYYISADFNAYGIDNKVVHAGKKVVATVDQLPSQVQADWDESDSDDDAFIKNKPDVTGKADKAVPAAAGNLASLDGNGNLTDSGKKAADFATAADATLTERSGFTEWSFTGVPDGLRVFGLDMSHPDGAPDDVIECTLYLEIISSGNADYNVKVSDLGILTATQLTFSGSAEGIPYSITATRSAKTGYKLGSQSDKPLAKDAEFQSHKADTTAHVTAQERTAWNGKAAAASLAPAFSPSSTYAVGDYVTHEGLLYKCTTAVSTAGAWNAANWDGPLAVTDEMGGSKVQADWDESDSDDPSFIRNKPTIPSAKRTRIYNIAGEDALDDKGQLFKSSVQGNYWIVGSNTVYNYGGYESSRHHWDNGDNSIRYYPGNGTIEEKYKDGWATRSNVVTTISTGLDPTNGDILPTVNGFKFGNMYASYTGTFTPRASALESTPYAKFALESLPDRTWAAVDWTVGDLVKHDSKAYRCIAAATSSDTTAPSSDTTHWAEIHPLSDYVQKAQTTGLLKNDGTVDTNQYLTQHQDISGKLDAAQRNLLDCESGGSTEIALSAQTAVYRAVLIADGSFPYFEDSGIPTASAYYQFELELSVPSTVPSTFTGPTGWTWIDGHGLPDPADLTGGETIYISVRLDCMARTFLASVWRVA